MSSIVKYTRKDGTTVAYESIAKWDPVKQQSRPIRKYLGMVDPETGEIIPTSGKRGRPPGSKNRRKASEETPENQETPDSQAEKERALRRAQMEAELQTLQEKAEAMQAEMDRLRKRNQDIERVLGNVLGQLAELAP